MLLPLLTVGLALLCGLQAQEESPEESWEDLEELSGSWYCAAMASNSSALISPGGHFRIFIDTLTVMDGNVHAEVLVLEGHRCRRDFITSLKTHRKNYFITMFWGYNEIYLVRVKPKDHLIYYIINHYRGVTSLVAYMLVRDPITRPELLQEFKSVCEGLGLHEGQIGVVGPQERCEMFRDY